MERERSFLPHGRRSSLGLVQTCLESSIEQGIRCEKMFEMRMSSFTLLNSFNSSSDLLYRTQHPIQIVVVLYLRPRFDLFGILMFCFDIFRTFIYFLRKCDLSRCFSF